jgi:hypothetical protein
VVSAGINFLSYSSCWACGGVAGRTGREPIPSSWGELLQPRRREGVFRVRFSALQSAVRRAGGPLFPPLRFKKYSSND